jgi:hypothetical protein
LLEQHRKQQEEQEESEKDEEKEVEEKKDGEKEEKKEEKKEAGDAQAGLNLEAMNRFGCTALHAACANGVLGGSNGKGGKGKGKGMMGKGGKGMMGKGGGEPATENPAMVAIVKMLVDAGASCTARMRSGDTPFSLVQQRNCVAMMQILQVSDCCCSCSSCYYFASSTSSSSFCCCCSYSCSAVLSSLSPPPSPLLSHRLPHPHCVFPLLSFLGFHFTGEPSRH